MASPIEHALVVISSVIENKNDDSSLAHYIRRLAQTCTDAGFPGKDGFTMEHPSNKEIEKITKEVNEKYQTFWSEKNLEK